MNRAIATVPRLVAPWKLSLLAKNEDKVAEGQPLPRTLKYSRSLQQSPPPCPRRVAPRKLARGLSTRHQTPKRFLCVWYRPPGERPVLRAPPRTLSRPPRHAAHEPSTSSPHPDHCSQRHLGSTLPCTAPADRPESRRRLLRLTCAPKSEWRGPHHRHPFPRHFPRRRQYLPRLLPRPRPPASSAPTREWHFSNTDSPKVSPARSWPRP